MREAKVKEEAYEKHASDCAKEKEQDSMHCALRCIEGAILTPALSKRSGSVVERSGEAEEDS